MRQEGARREEGRKEEDTLACTPVCGIKEHVWTVIQTTVYTVNTNAIQ